jgi:hypothetical protein
MGLTLSKGKLLDSRKRSPKLEAAIQRKAPARPIVPPITDGETMSFTLAPLLIHSEEVPAAAREALRAAYRGSSETRTPHLESAARLLCRDTLLDCSEARDLVGLPAGCGA